MRLVSWILGVGLASSAFAADGAVQWALRFGEVRNHGNALVGCYGTASYRYVLPTVEELRRHRRALAAVARAKGLGTDAWSSQQDGKRPGNVFLVDLSDGKARSVPKVFGPRAATFCRCAAFDLLFCTPSALPPLAPIFYTVADDVPEAESPHWTDPVTGLEWKYRFANACWARSDHGCRSEGLRLPTYEELLDAAPRLKATGIGAWARRRGQPLWSSTEEGESAWTVHLDSGRSELRSKPECLQAACVH